MSDKIMNDFELNNRYNCARIIKLFFDFLINLNSKFSSPRLRSL